MNIWRKIYVWIWIRVRIIRLHFMYMPKPDDAKTPEEMLEAIRRRIDSDST